MKSLQELNALSRAEAVTEFRKCCGTLKWAENMADARPFQDPNTLFKNADKIWNALNPSEWREAFEHHPEIGANPKSNTWESEEQKGVASASQEILRRIADGNVRYEAKYGYIFLVCATGKSASEMLEILEKRMENLPDFELRIAAAEQAKITRIRLEKLIS